VAKHNGWTLREQEPDLTAALSEPAAHILHGVTTAATYKEVSEAHENRYSDNYLEAAFHSQRREGPSAPGNLCRRLVPPTTT
jgi:hypothetical protein